MSRRDEGKYVLRPVGWGPFRMPGERKRLEELTKKYEEIFARSGNKIEQAVVPLQRPKPVPVPAVKPSPGPKVEVPPHEADAAPEQPAEDAASLPWQPPPEPHASPQPSDDARTMPIPIAELGRFDGSAAPTLDVATEFLTDPVPHGENRDEALRILQAAAERLRALSTDDKVASNHDAQKLIGINLSEAISLEFYLDKSQPLDFTLIKQARKVASDIHSLTSRLTQGPGTQASVHTVRHAALDAGVGAPRHAAESWSASPSAHATGAPEQPHAAPRHAAPSPGEDPSIGFGA